MQNNYCIMKGPKNHLKNGSVHIKDIFDKPHLVPLKWVNSYFYRYLFSCIYITDVIILPP